MRKPKRSIAIVCRILWTGGVSLVAIEQQRQFLLEGADSTLIFLRDAGSVYKLPEKTIILHGRERTERIAGRFLWNVTKKFAGHRGNGATVDLDYILGASKELYKFDRIIFQDQWSAIPGVFLRMRGIPYILLFHEFFRVPPGMNRRSVLAILAWVYDLFSILIAPAVVSTSEFNYNLVNKFKKNAYLVRIGFPNPNRNEFRASKFSDSRKAVLSISLWDKGRNPYFYAQLAERLPFLNFILAGTWTIKEEEINFRETYKHLSNLFVTGSISDEEKTSFLINSHFYLRIGYDERGPGMGGLEAMSYGVVPFTNKGLGLSEIIQDGINGFIIEEPLLEKAIEALKFAGSMCPEPLIAIAERNFDLCETYSWKKNVAELGKIFQIIDPN
jgi:glycosyltransferase involved in cell wall biosynthesis